jgi:predicted transcriptional regulator YdeE
MKKTPFYVIGIAVRTTNENMQAATDIPALWNTFMTEGIAGKIPNKTGDELYCVYTEYELDYTKPYTTVLGCAVQDLSEIPEGMKGIEIAGGDYQQFTATGNMKDNIVYNEWVKIWDSGISRAYTTDFEVYGKNAQHPENAEVPIYIALKN